MDRNLVFEPARTEPGKLFGWVASAGLIVAVCCTIYGFVRLDDLPPRPWHPSEWTVVGLAIAAPAFLMGIGAFTRHWLRAVVLAVAGTALVTYGPAVLLVLLLCGVGAVSIGHLIFRIELDSTESVLLAFVTGFGALGVTIGYTAALRLHFDFVYGALLIGAAVLARRPLSASARQTFAALWQPFPDTSRRAALMRLGMSVPVVIALLLMLYASARETGFDALTTHFYLVDQLKLHGRFPFDTSVLPFVLMPKTAVWSLSVAHILGGEFALRALHASLFLVTAGLIAGRAAPAMGPASAALLVATLLSAPVVLWVSSQFFEESATVMFVAAAAVFFLRGENTDKPFLTDALALACLGMAVSAKAQALFLGTLGVIIVLRRLSQSGVSLQVLFRIAGGCALFAVMAFGPYGRAFLTTGNPFYPFKPGETIDARWEHPLSATNAYDMVFNTTKHMEAWPGGFAFQFLILLMGGALALLLMRWKSVSALALAALTFGFVLASQTHYARYQIYAFPLLMLCLAALYPQMTGWVRGAVTASLLACTALNVTFWQSVHVPTFQLRQLLNPALSPDVPAERRTYDALNALYGAETSVYVAGRTRYSGGLEGVPHARSQLALKLDAAADINSLAAGMRTGRITHIVLSGPPANPLILELCRAACTEYPAMPGGIRVFAVDASRVSLIADRLDAFELLGLEKPVTASDAAGFAALDGWSKEAWGWWSTASVSRIDLSEAFAGASALEFEVRPFSPPGKPALTVSIDLDGTALGNWTFKDVVVGQIEIRRIDLPAPIDAGAPGILTLTYSSTLTPDEVLRNGDKRQLALGLVDISR